VLNDKEQKERLELAERSEEIAAAALKVRLEIAAKSKMDLGEVAAPVAVAADGTAAPAADGAAAAAPAADAKEAPADKDKK
jgi:hypothetical protein